MESYVVLVSGFFHSAAVFKCLSMYIVTRSSLLLLMAGNSILWHDRPFFFFLILFIHQRMGLMFLTKKTEPLWISVQPIAIEFMTVALVFKGNTMKKKTSSNDKTNLKLV